jgi:Flp pilus assembly protein TadD
MEAASALPEKLQFRCCIAGGGPAGMMLGFLLARAGIEVMVLEKHADFLRDFRGDTIHPSTFEVVHELGVLEALLKRPHQQLPQLSAQIGSAEVVLADFSRLSTQCRYIALMPQWDFLNFLAEQARRYPTFHLRMQAEVTGLIEDAGRVVGVRAKTPGGALEIRAEVTVGADGRNSIVRDCSGLKVEDLGAPMDGLALKALEIDNTLAEAHTSLGAVKEQYWDWEGCEREHKRAIELQPGYANAHHWYTFYLAQMGRLDEADAEIRRARELDPLSLIINTDLGWLCYLARHYDQAIEQLRKTLELDPSFVSAHYLLGRSYLEKAMYEEATVELQRATHLSGCNAVFFAGLGCAYAASGKREEAIHILNELEERSKRRYVPPYDVALVYVALGQKDNAFTWLEKAFEERSDFKAELRVGPILDPLRSDPRFKDLLRRVNFPP